MAVKYIEENVLTNLANTVRAVFNESGKLTLNNMANIIRNKDYEYNTANMLGGVIIGANINGNYADMSNYFNGNTSVKGTPFVGNAVINMASAYRGCTNLTGEADFGLNVENMSYAYAGCKNLVNMPNLAYTKKVLKGLNLKDCSYAFYNTRLGLESQEWMREITSPNYEINCSGMFMNSDFYTSDPSRTAAPGFFYRTGNTAYMFRDCKNLKIPEINTYMDNAYGMYMNCNFLSIAPSWAKSLMDRNIFYSGFTATDVSYVMYNTKFTGDSYFNFFGPGYSSIWATKAESVFENSNVTGYAYTCFGNVLYFQNAYRNSGISYAAFRKNMENVSNAYRDCENLIDISVAPSYSNIIDMSNAFRNCTNFCPSTIFITNKVVNCRNMINNCPSMNNSSITIFGNIFTNENKTTTTYIPDTGTFFTNVGNLVMEAFYGSTNVNRFFHNTKDNIFGIILTNDAWNEFNTNYNNENGVKTLLANYLFQFGYTQTNDFRLTNVSFSLAPASYNYRYINVLDPETNTYFTRSATLRRYVTNLRIYYAASGYIQNYPCAIGIYQL